MWQILAAHWYWVVGGVFALAFVVVTWKNAARKRDIISLNEPKHK